MTAENDRVDRFVESLRDDPRVLGIARRGVGDSQQTRLFVVSTWDGGVTLPAELSRLCAPLVGGGVPIEELRTGGDLRVAAIWEGLGADGTRAEVVLMRAEDLVPDGISVYAKPLHDPRGLIERYASAREREKGPTRSEQRRFLMADGLARSGGRTSSRHVGILRSVRDELSPDDPAQSSLAARIGEALRAEPGPGEGYRPGLDPASSDREWEGTREGFESEREKWLEHFLSTADDEGFKGDRVLFGEAVKRLRELSKREPVFDQGFVVPTFDAVEAGFVTGDAVPGATSLLPGVYVGVGVTPKDALEFWAAPFVREPSCSVACVDDTGERDVVLRTAGRDPMIASLTRAIDAAWARLPGLLAAAAATETVDPAAAIATLHLPRSFVERAKSRGAGVPSSARIGVALALARAGHDCAPLVARKFGLAAGRVLANR